MWISRDAGGQDLATIAVNVEPRLAHTDTQSEPAVSTWLADSGSWAMAAPEKLTEILEIAHAGSPLGRMLLLILLLLVLLETLLARWFSHATQSRHSVLSIVADPSVRPAVGGIR